MQSKESSPLWYSGWILEALFGVLTLLKVIKFLKSSSNNVEVSLWLSLVMFEHLMFLSLFSGMLFFKTSRNCRGTLLAVRLWIWNVSLIKVPNNLHIFYFLVRQVLKVCKKVWRCIKTVWKKFIKSWNVVKFQIHWVHHKVFLLRNAMFSCAREMISCWKINVNLKSFYKNEI